MKILTIAPQPFFSYRGTAFSVYYSTLVNSEQGVEIDLLTYGEGEGEGEEIDLPGVKVIRIPTFSFLGPVKVGPSYLKAFLDFFMFFWTVGLLLKNRYDCVDAHEESAFYCLFLKKIFRFKLIYEMHSSLPQQLRNFKFTKSKFLIGLFEKLEKRCLQKSDAIVTICPALATYALQFIPEKNRHHLIENSLFEPVKLKDQVKHEKPLEISIPKGRQLIVYAGTFESYQGIDLLLSSFQKVVQHRSEAFLLLIGGTPDQVAFYQEIAKKNHIERDCLIHERVPQSQLDSFIRNATLQISPRVRGMNTPLKIYQQLASDIPLVATNVLAHTQILSDEVCFLVEPNPESMAQGLMKAFSIPEVREKKVRNANAFYEKNYSRDVYRKKIEKLLNFLGK